MDQGHVGDGVWAERATDGATADENAAFRFDDLVPGDYFVRALDKAAGLVGDAHVSVGPEHTSSNPAVVRVVLLGSGSVSGSVLKRAGDSLVPVPHAMVAGGLRLVTADADGRFVASDVPVGVNEMRALDPQTGAMGSARVTILSAGQASVGIDIVVEPLGTVEGQVLNADGTPAASAEVRLILQGDSSVGWTTMKANTASNGTYRFERVAAGDYPITAKGNGVAEGRALLPAGVSSVAVNLRLVRPTARVSGWVVDESGMRVAAKVALRGMAPNPVNQLEFTDVATAVSDPDRGFAFERFYVGPYSVTASSFFAPVSVTASGVLTAAQPTVDGLVLTLAKNTGTLHGCVLDPEGRRITSILDDKGVPLPLSVFITSGALRSELSKDTQNPEPDGIRVDASGGCYVSTIPLPPDGYRVEVRDERPGSPTYGLSGAAFTDIKRGEDAEKDVRLLGLGSIAVEVVDASGVAVRGVDI